MNKKNGKAFRAGGYSLVLCVIITLIVVAANLLVGQLPSTATKLDMTKEKLYSLTDETKTLAQSLQEDVTIYLIAQRGNENALVSEFIERYTALSSHIKTQTVDPVAYPNFVSQYTSEALSDNSIIVASEKRSRTIDSSTLFVSDQYAQYLGGDTDTSTFNGEYQLSSALNYVTSDNLPILYALTGHGEQTLSNTFSKYVSDRGVELKTLSLLTQTEVPEDAGALFIDSPTKDFSETELKIIKTYLEGGGRLLLVTDYAETDLPNLSKLMEGYGVETVDGVVLEQDANHYVTYPILLVPNIESHDITQNAEDDGLYAIAPGAQGIKTIESYRSTLTIDPLLTTSDSAFSKQNPNQMTTSEKEEGDLEGPFNLAVAISEKIGEAETKVVWFSTSGMISDEYDSLVSGGNSSIFLGSISWMCEMKNPLTIRSIEVTYDKLTLTEAKANFWGIVLMAGIPLVILAAGVAVIVKRRKR